MGGSCAIIFDEQLKYSIEIAIKKGFGLEKSSKLFSDILVTHLDLKAY